MARKRKRGFTLVEILVVISIISILAAILLPVFSAVRASARSASCISNLRQIGLGLALYRQDYDSYYPFAINPAVRRNPWLWADDPYDPGFEALIPTLPEFHDILSPYERAHDVFRCPSDTGMIALQFCLEWDTPAPSSAYETYGTSYFYLTDYAGYHFRDGSIQFPSRAAVVLDAGSTWHGGSGGPFPVGCGAARNNVLFADLHVGELNYIQLGDAFAQVDRVIAGPR